MLRLSYPHDFTTNHLVRFCNGPQVFRDNCWVWAQPVRDDVRLLRRLALAEHIPRVIPGIDADYHMENRPYSRRQTQWSPQTGGRETTLAVKPIWAMDRNRYPNYMRCLFLAHDIIEHHFFFEWEIRNFITIQNIWYLNCSLVSVRDLSVAAHFYGSSSILWINWIIWYFESSTLEDNI